MAAASVRIVKDDDGGVSLVAKHRGVDVTFATVNPSAFAELAKSQGVSLSDDGDGDDGEGEG